LLSSDIKISQRRREAKQRRLMDHLTIGKSQEEVRDMVSFEVSLCAEKDVSELQTCATPAVQNRDHPVEKLGRRRRSCMRREIQIRLQT
jgi:hypothetical protein